MRIGKSVPVTYSMEDNVSNISTNLEAADQEKDLGVWCTSSLKPSAQCQKVATEASQALGTIRRSFKINSANTLLKMKYALHARKYALVGHTYGMSHQHTTVSVYNIL